MINQPDPETEFEIKCKNCESTKVHVDANVGFSPQSGGWGAVRLVCETCGNKTDIWEPTY